MQSRLDILHQALDRLGWQVAPFLSPKDAVESLRSARYDAVFCDEQLRGASPAGLLVWTRRALPGIPFFLFSNSPDPNRFRVSGAPNAVLHFPPVLAQLPIPADTPPLEVPLQALETPLSGSTALLSLTDLIEMMGLAQQSGVIELGGGKDGLAVLHKGRLEHAASFQEPQRSGLQALAQLLSLPDADFRVAPYRPPGRATLNLSASAALTEAARLVDEARRFKLLLEAVQAKCPAALAVVVGQPLPGLPMQGVGEVARLNGMVRQALELSRAALGGRVLDGLLVTDEHALVLNSFAEGRMLAALAPAGAKAALYRAVQAAVADL